MRRILPPWSLYSWMLFYLWYATKTLSLPHQLPENLHRGNSLRTVVAGAIEEEYMDLDAKMEKLELRFWQQRHRVKRQSDSQCNESLQSALISCQNSVTLNTTVLSDPNLNQSALLRTQFCGLQCRTKMFIHAFQCTIQSFIVEVSGDCKNGNEASCIHAAVVMVDGVIYCSLELDHGSLQTSGDDDESASRSVPTDLDSCSLSTSYSTEVEHRFLHDTQIGRQVLTPPLKPPWQNCSNFAFSNNSASSSDTNSDSSTVSPPLASSASSGTFSGIGVSQDLSATTNGALRHHSKTHLTVCIGALVYLCCLVLSMVHFM